MLGCTGSFTNQSADPASSSQDIYIHGYVSGRIFKSGKNADGQGLPITISATFLDGLVLSLTPFHNSCNYRSAVVYGYASIVDDADEALYAMKLITDNLIPQRWEKSRTPPTSAELKSTSILKVRVESGMYISHVALLFAHLAFPIRQLACLVYIYSYHSCHSCSLDISRPVLTMSLPFHMYNTLLPYLLPPIFPFSFSHICMRCTSVDALTQTYSERKDSSRWTE
jgi:nitroimidazol reductase NimA-like FMN-containing flavoprotein (pyridoxamine 5'-phosphate oxidase superfamily)